MSRLGHISLDAKFSKDQMTSYLKDYLNNDLLPTPRELPLHWNLIGYQHLQQISNLYPEWALGFANSTKAA